MISKLLHSLMENASFVASSVLNFVHENLRFFLLFLGNETTCFHGLCNTDKKPSTIRCPKLFPRESFIPKKEKKKPSTNYRGRIPSLFEKRGGRALSFIAVQKKRESLRSKSFLVFFLGKQFKGPLLSFLLLRILGGKNPSSLCLATFVWAATMKKNY